MIVNNDNNVTILILIDGFLQYNHHTDIEEGIKVTILILIDGFLQSVAMIEAISYFSVTILILIDGFLQFNQSIFEKRYVKGHNPYFNRWFSAIKLYAIASKYPQKVTILILIDGFLQ